MLITFDAPSSTTSCPRRERSNTPLQALSLLNDPVFVKCARALADRLVAECGSQEGDRLRQAFRLSVGRSPTEDEIVDLDELYRKVEKIYQREHLTGTEAPRAIASSDGTALEVAALTVVARAVLNLDEVITRE